MRHTDFHPDARIGDLIVEVKRGGQAAGWMRGAAIQVAVALATDPKLQALLVLAEPKMTDSRLAQELSELRKVLRPEIGARLFVTSVRDGIVSQLPQELGGGLEEFVLQRVAHETRLQGAKRGTAWFSVLEVLVHHWLKGSPPTSIADLMSTTGLSYPSVAAAIERLRHVVGRSSDRRVDLLRFPRDEWEQLLSASEDVRETIRFADRSGKPRAIETLVRRFEALGRTDVALGGVLGATHHLPSLDVIGTPRLDVSIHAPHGTPDMGIVALLDAALERTSRREESAAVVLHVVRRRNPLFEHGADGQTWADPTECLLDLQEARLESQAQQFIHELAARHGRRA